MPEVIPQLHDPESCAFHLSQGDRCFCYLPQRLLLFASGIEGSLGGGEEPWDKHGACDGGSPFPSLLLGNQDSLSGLWPCPRVALRGISDPLWTGGPRRLFSPLPHCGATRQPLHGDLERRSPLLRAARPKQANAVAL